MAAGIYTYIEGGEAWID